MAIGPWQILVVALIILLLFGASRLADIGKGLGEGIRNFKKGVSDDGSDEKLTEGDDEKEPKQLPPKSDDPKEKKV